MVSIHPEVQDFDDEVNKENMNKFCSFIADQKLENTKHKTKYKQTCASFVERRTRRGK